MEGSILARKDRVSLDNGMDLRLLSALEVLQARREAAELAREDRERALCSNACLLAKAMVKNGLPVFQSGTEVLEKLRVEEIADLSRRWAQFNRRENPSPEDEQERVDELKKAWSTRLMSALNGVCSAILGCFPPRRRRGK